MAEFRHARNLPQYCAVAANGMLLGGHIPQSRECNEYLRDAVPRTADSDYGFMFDHSYVLVSIRRQYSSSAGCNRSLAAIRQPYS